MDPQEDTFSFSDFNDNNEQIGNEWGNLNKLNESLSTYSAFQQNELSTHQTGPFTGLATGVSDSSNSSENIRIDVPITNNQRKFIIIRQKRDKAKAKFGKKVDKKEESEFLKKKMKREKNKESARRSRESKKNELENLKKEVAELQKYKDTFDKLDSIEGLCDNCKNIIKNRINNNGRSLHIVQGPFTTLPIKKGAAVGAFIAIIIFGLIGSVLFTSPTQIGDTKKTAIFKAEKVPKEKKSFETITPLYGLQEAKPIFGITKCPNNIKKNELIEPMNTSTTAIKPLLYDTTPKGSLYEDILLTHNQSENELFFSSQSNDNDIHLEEESKELIRISNDENNIKMDIEEDSPRLIVEADNIGSG